VLAKLHKFIDSVNKYRCFKDIKRYSKLNAAQQQEQKSKQDLLPDKKDGITQSESEYWASKQLVYFACKGNESPQNLKQFWEETDYYEILELMVLHTVYSIQQS
jgi:hypothetical protein